MSVSEMSGLEILQALARGELPMGSIADTIPMTMINVEQGQVTLQATANKTHLNPMGAVHGGFASTLLETAGWCSVYSTIEKGVACSTIDMNIKLVRSIPKEETLVVEGKVINLSKTIGIAEATLKHDNGDLLAYGTASCLISR